MMSGNRSGISEIARYAWRETSRRKRRSLWNMAGYAVMAGFLVATLSASRMSGDAANSALWLTGAQFAGFVVNADSGRDAAKLIDPEREGFYIHNNPTLLFPLSLVEKIAASPNVRSAAPILSFRIRTKDSGRPWLLAGFDAADMGSVRNSLCSATDIVNGRFLAPGDSGAVLLEQTFAEVENLDVGDKVSLGGRDFTVIGTMSPGTRPAKADVYMPIREAVEVVNTRLAEPLGERVNVALVDGASALANAKAIAEVKEILGKNATVVGFGCYNPAGKAIFTTLGGVRLLTAVVVIVVGALAVLSQYFSAVERRFDIGVLKAIGWPDRSVVGQIFLEAALQAFVGGLAGCAVAAALFALFPVGAWLGIPGAAAAHVSGFSLVLGMALTLCAGALAGGLSAFAAARTRPADILRKA